jgi:hypothetical protein
MKKSHIYFLTAFFVLFLGVVDASAQWIYRAGMSQEFKKDPAKLEAYYRYQREAVKQHQQKQAKKLSNTYRRLFDSLQLNNGEVIAAQAERRFIESGDSVRIKFVFNNRIVDHISVGEQSTKLTDIRDGHFIATVKPEKSKVIYANVSMKNGNGERLPDTPMSFIIMVFDSKEYKKVMNKVEKFEEKGDYHGRDQYLISLEGKDLRSKR